MVTKPCVVQEGYCKLRIEDLKKFLKILQKFDVRFLRKMILYVG